MGSRHRALDFQSGERRIPGLCEYSDDEKAYRKAAENRTVSTHITALGTKQEDRASQRGLPLIPEIDRKDAKSYSEESKWHTE